MFGYKMIISHFPTHTALVTSAERSFQRQRTLLEFDEKFQTLILFIIMFSF